MTESNQPSVQLGEQAPWLQQKSKVAPWDTYAVAGLGLSFVGILLAAAVGM